MVSGAAGSMAPGAAPAAMMVAQEAEVRQEMGLSSQWQSQADSLGQVESVLNEPSDQGISNLLDQFWNSWQDLSNQPEDSGARAEVDGREAPIAPDGSARRSSKLRASAMRGAPFSAGVAQRRELPGDS